MKTTLSILLLFVVTTFTQISAQQLSNKATISVITCGPGDQLYSTFGHSAFRVFDPLQNFDKVYNYGTFDFNAPNFYLNFAKGKLTYLLSTTSFSRFLREYQYENRWVKTQQLNLSSKEIQLVFEFLETNAKPENRAYKYDFFYNNCSTKIEDVLKVILKDKLVFNNSHITTHKTHRDLIADYTINQKWSKFGIDLALGAVIDKEASKDDYKFLPDYIFKAIENATIKTSNGTIPLVKKEQNILLHKPINNNNLITPFYLILILSLIIIYATYKNYKLVKKTKIIDFLLLFTTGFIGVLVLLLWFATTHTATYNNLNFLWAFAPNLVVSFFMLKDKQPKWTLYYFIALIILMVIMLICWLLKVQVYNIALLPFIIALITRYYFNIKTFKPKNL